MYTSFAEKRALTDAIREIADGNKLTEQIIRKVVNYEQILEELKKLAADLYGYDVCINADFTEFSCLTLELHPGYRCTSHIELIRWMQAHSLKDK